MVLNSIVLSGFLHLLSQTKCECLRAYARSSCVLDALIDFMLAAANVTSWNSTFRAIRRVLRLRTRIIALLRRSQRRP
jgi:hypothetical protein